MYYPKFIVSNQKEELVYKGLNAHADVSSQS